VKLLAGGCGTGGFLAEGYGILRKVSDRWTGEFLAEWCGVADVCVTVILMRALCSKDEELT
jgi:hypothetical protein